MNGRRRQGVSVVDLNGEHDWVVRDWDDDGPRDAPAIIDGGRGGVAVCDNPSKERFAAAGDDWIAGEEALLSACGTSSGWPRGIGEDWRRVRLVDAMRDASELNDRPVLMAARALAGEAARLVFVADLHDERPRTQAERLTALFPRLKIVARRDALQAFLDDGEPAALLLGMRGALTLFAPDEEPARIWPWPGTATDHAESRLEHLSQTSGVDKTLLQRGARSIWSAGESAPFGGDAIRLRNGDYRVLPALSSRSTARPGVPAEMVDALRSFRRSCAVWSPCATVGEALAETLASALHGRAPTLLPAHAAALGAMRLLRSRR